MGDTESDPLQVAISNMRWIAGYYIVGVESDKLGEMLKPWNAAYDKLAQPQDQ